MHPVRAPPARSMLARMDMLGGAQIAAADLSDWRKLAQGLHARFLIDGFTDGARFVAAIGEAGDAAGHHPQVALRPDCVDLKLVSGDAIYRDDAGTEHVVEWVTQKDLDLAQEISGIAAAQGLRADPAAVTQVELGLDTSHPSTIAAVWAALLTGDPASQGRGTPSDEVRDATGRVPNLWFGDPDPDAGGGGAAQRFHLEVYVAPEVAADRVAAAVAAGGSIVDDSDAPGLTVIADQDGNTGVICTDQSATTGG